MLFEVETAELTKLKRLEATSQHAHDLGTRLLRIIRKRSDEWQAAIARGGEQWVTGDALYASAFLVYCGHMNREHRGAFMRRLQQDLTDAEIATSERPLDLLTTAAEERRFVLESLPAEHVLTSSAAIVVRCRDVPFMIDPQHIAIQWLRAREAINNLIVTIPGDNLIDELEKAVTTGQPIVILNFSGHDWKCIEPLITRAYMRDGSEERVVLDNREIRVNGDFRLYLQTEDPLPELDAKCWASTTVVSFVTTQECVTSQLLRRAFEVASPDQSSELHSLQRRTSELWLSMDGLETKLLEHVCSAQGSLQEDLTGELAQMGRSSKTNWQEFVVELEQIDSDMSREVAESTEVAAATAQIEESMNALEATAQRAALVYECTQALIHLDSTYLFSYELFGEKFDGCINNPTVVKAVEAGEAAPLAALVVQVTTTLYEWAAQSLLGRHRLVFASQIGFCVLKQAGELPAEQLELLMSINKPAQQVVSSSKPFELDFITQKSWSLVTTLGQQEMFERLADDMLTNTKRFKTWCQQERPELGKHLRARVCCISKCYLLLLRDLVVGSKGLLATGKLPLDYKALPSFSQLVLTCCLRTDRLAGALGVFVEETLGAHFVSDLPCDLSSIMATASPGLPLLLLLSIPVDIARQINPLASGVENGVACVSLGDAHGIGLAECELGKRVAEGGWLILLNLHLVELEWLQHLGQSVESYNTEAHPDFRLIFTYDLMSDARLPIKLLKSSIKVCFEAAKGVQAQLKRSWGVFSDDYWENAAQPNEVKCAIFGVCYAHSAMVQRCRYGARGWNSVCSLSDTHLLEAAEAAIRFLEYCTLPIPWSQFRFLLDEAVYGPRLEDQWDRRVCSAYLRQVMTNDLLETGSIWSGIEAPPVSANHDRVAGLLEETLKFPESGAMLWMAPGADFVQGEICSMGCVDDLRVSHLVDGLVLGAVGAGDAAGPLMELVLESLSELFVEGWQLDSGELHRAVEENSDGWSGYTRVLWSEAKRVEALREHVVGCMKKLKGEDRLVIPREMSEHTQIIDGYTPTRWLDLGCASEQSLARWLVAIKHQVRQLLDWGAELYVPKAIWLPGLYHPQGLIAAVMQAQARTSEWALEDVVVTTEVTALSFEEVEQAATDGAYIYGLFLDGASYSDMLQPAKLHRQLAAMPVMKVRPMLHDKAELMPEVTKAYECPVYRSELRAGRPLCAFHLKSGKDPTGHPDAHIWILAGVALVMSIASSTAVGD